MKYWVYNPTGNVTVLVSGDASARSIMDMEPECEQLGYILYDAEGYDIRLRMAGGEFCGNATMCTAYHYARKNGLKKAEVTVYVDGTGPVKAGIDGNAGWVEMPEPYEITELNGYPLVRFMGIDHMIVEAPEYKSREYWESEVKRLCTSEAMGIMLLSGDVLSPLVYVKSIDTLFWESSCASGTSAIGFWKNSPIELKEPAGVLRFEHGRLYGSVELVKEVSEPHQ